MPAEQWEIHDTGHVKLEGESPVSKWGFTATAFGILFYMADMGSDVVTAVQFGYSGDWWRCVVTFGIVYLAILISSIRKWRDDDVLWTGPCDKLQYFVSLLVNGPDLKECWALLHVEWTLLWTSASPTSLLSLWQMKRLCVSWLKTTEGVWEACPQVFLQLVLLLSDLNAGITWTVSVYVRLMGLAISFCTAAAAPVHRQNIYSFHRHTAPSVGELFVLHMWAVPVTMSRLLCLVLLVIVHPYWSVACVILHYVLYGLYSCSTERGQRMKTMGFGISLLSLLFLISPFDNSETSRSCVVQHAIHSLSNFVVEVMLILYPPLHCMYPELYTTVIVTIPVLFLIGMLGWLLHWTYWQRNITSPYDCRF